MNGISLQQKNTPTPFFIMEIGVGVILIACLVLIGWLTHIPTFISIFPAWYPMSPDAAGCFILCGLALILLCTSFRYHYLLIRTLAILVMAITISSRFLLEDFMALDSTLIFILISMAILLISLKKPYYSFSQWLCILSLIIPFIVFINYLFAFNIENSTIYYFHLAFHAAGLFIMLAVGLLCIYPHNGYMSLVFSDSLGGVMTRRTLGLVIFLPLLVGIIGNLLLTTHIFTSDFVLALMVTITVFALCYQIIKIAKSLNQLASSLQESNRQLKIAQTETELTLTALKRSNEDLEQFAYVASHDLQEPLRMISSYTQLLAKRYQTKLDQDAFDFIGFAVDGAQRMQALLQDLLAYSRVHRKTNPFTLTDANNTLNQVLSNLTFAIKESAAVITSDPLPTVIADPVQLMQLFQNLIANAIKFHPKDQVTHLHISAQLKNKYWQFAFQDNGIGIEKAYLEQIFIIFKRLHSQTDYAGTGLGLAVCKKIVERHNGKIWVESTPNKGSTFYFTLPEERVNE